MFFGSSESDCSNLMIKIGVKIDQYYVTTKGGLCNIPCLVPRPHYCVRPMRFGSRGPFVLDTSPRRPGKTLYRDYATVFPWFQAVIFLGFSPVTWPFWMPRERRRWFFDLSKERLGWRLGVSFCCFISFDWYWIDILGEFSKLLMYN